MSGASMNGIKARMKSVQSTMQITKAMELVATSKLRRAKERAEGVRPYQTTLEETLVNLLAAAGGVMSPYTKPYTEGRVLFVVVAGDRGLAGGYNSNIFRMERELSDGADALYLPIGKKAVEHYRRRGAEIFSDKYEEVGDLGVGAAMRLGEEISRGFLDGAFSKVVLLYTRFTSMMTQTPVSETLLPAEMPEGKGAPPPEILVDEAPEEMLASLFPQYVGGRVYAALCESVASECGARRTAMNAANKNASEMIDSLMLRYNRARQAVITQEITEIVSGAEAL